MLNNNVLIERLEFHEGYRANKYICTGGKTTQGIGHNLDNNPLNETEKIIIKDLNHWTKPEARFVLSNDIEKCKLLLNNMVRGFNKLDDERQYALVDMCFQLGINGLLKFKKMLKAIEVGDFEEASKQCLDSSYAKQTPSRANRIARLIKTGVWEI
jgi:lysozyme